MDEILHHLRNPGMMLPLYLPTNNDFSMVSKWCRISSIHSSDKLLSTRREMNKGMQKGRPFEEVPNKTRFEAPLQKSKRQTIHSYEGHLLIPLPCLTKWVQHP